MASNRIPSVIRREKADEAFRRRGRVVRGGAAGDQRLRRGFVPVIARILLLAAILVAPLARAQVSLTHVHGLAYSADGKRLMIPSHHGLAIYEAGRWSNGGGPRHDYMGFAATAGGLYSSGHPVPGSGLVNPFGLLRSRDGARSWEKLGLEGESDFHLLAAGWNSGVIYVWNEQPNSRMRNAGLHFTTSEGFAWVRAEARAVTGKPRALAAHPTDPKLVAVATAEGVFESSDAGRSFARIAPAEGTAVFYDLDGKHLWHGRYDGQPRLARARLRGGPAALLALPPLHEDAVAYMAQNPARHGEYAIATFRRSVYLSPDAGRSWQQIAREGSARDAGSR